MSRVYGVDVSHWHRVLDWSKVLATDAMFFGAKATEGTNGVDPTFVAHRDGFRQQQKMLLACYYHFCGHGDPRAEAAHFLATTGPVQPNERLVLDVEGETPVHIDWVTAFVAALPKARRPIVYTSDQIWKLMGNPPWPDATVGNVDLWDPRYDDGTTEPVVPSPWPFWRFWQFSETFVCPGIDGPCDASYFQGDLDDLKKYAA